jgi:hypothetical protein
MEVTTLTNKEINTLNLLFKKLQGKRVSVEDAYDILAGRFGFKPHYAQKMSLLYVLNWRPDGNFNKIENFKVLRLGEYEGTGLSHKALMYFLNDYDLSNYQFTDETCGLRIIYKNSKDYIVLKVHEDPLKPISYLLACFGENGICQERDFIKDYITLDSDYADDVIYNFIDNLSDEEVLHFGDDSNWLDHVDNLYKKIEYNEDRINKRVDKMNSFWDQLERAEKEFNDTRVKEIESKMKVLSDEIESINGQITDIEDKILDDIEEFKDSLKDIFMEEAKDDPVGFFVDKIKLDTFKNLLKRGIFESDCPQAIFDYLEMEPELVKGVKELFNYENVHQIEFNRNNYLIIN